MSPSTANPACQSVQDSQESLTSVPLETQQKRSPDTKQRPWTRFYRNWVTDWWLFELICLALGTASMVSTVVLLVSYENKRVPGLNSFLGVNITLNTIIAILGTIGRASLLYSVTECISQQRWAWFSGPAKPLTDLESFDQGSRGAWGSFLLIWKLRVRHFVSLGAFILIFALAVDPLSQQLVNYNLQRQVDTLAIAYVPISQDWDLYYGDSYDTTFQSMSNELNKWGEPLLYMKAAVSNGLFFSDVLLKESPGICSTGNCTWPLYQSLAVCSKWKDVSDHLVFTNTSLETPIEGTNETVESNVYRWSLNDYHYIESTGTELYYLNMSSMVNGTDLTNASYAFDPKNTATFICNNCSFPIADTFIIWRDPSKVPFNAAERLMGIVDKNAYSALEFVFEWCIQEFNTTVANGESSTTRTASTKYFGSGDVMNLNGIPGDSYPDMKLDGLEYNITVPAHYSLATYPWKTFRGIIVADRSETMYQTSDVAEAVFKYFEPGIGNASLPSTAQIYNNLDTGLQNIAISMTNAIRARDLTYLNLTTNQRPPAGTTRTALGTAWRDQAVVNVRWGWIAAPILLFVLSVIFVLVTIIQSRMHSGRYSIWKSSALATLLSLSDDAHQRVSGIESISEMENKLNSTRASLKRDPDGKWRL